MIYDDGIHVCMRERVEVESGERMEGGLRGTGRMLFKVEKSKNLPFSFTLTNTHTHFVGVTTIK